MEARKRECKEKETAAARKATIVGEKKNANEKKLASSLWCPQATLFFFQTPPRLSNRRVTRSGAKRCEPRAPQEVERSRKKRREVFCIDGGGGERAAKRRRLQLGEPASFSAMPSRRIRRRRRENLSCENLSRTGPRRPPIASSLRCCKTMDNDAPSLVFERPAAAASTTGEAMVNPSPDRRQAG